jgi:glycosyltransferase involved in cell wall biosynthesis
MVYLKPKLLIATTVPETLATILQGQPEYLSKYFETAVVTSAGEPTLDMPKKARFTVNMHRGISPIADLKSIIAMVKVIRTFKPDIIHSYTPKAGLVCMVAGFLCRVSVRIHTFTGLIFPTTLNRLKHFVLKQVDALICACATMVVAEGAGVKRDLARFKVTSKPIHIIGHGNIAGLDSTYFDPSLPVIKHAVTDLDNNLDRNLKNNLASNLENHASFTQSTDAFIFLFVGRLNRDKGLKELAQAFVELDEQAVLWLVGSLDPTAPPDANTLETLKKHPRIKQMGFLHDVRGVLARCNVLVLPSYREGFPNVLLQAGAMQKPVIATDINGSNEIVLAGETGWLVAAKNAGALKQAMLQAMQTTIDQRLKMGLAARKRVQKLFEREDYLSVLVSFYQSLTKQTNLIGSNHPSNPSTANHPNKPDNSSKPKT